jgi:hypothetical protein
MIEYHYKSHSPFIFYHLGKNELSVYKYPMSSRIKNLTASDVVIVDDEGIPVYIFEVTGLVPRVTYAPTANCMLAEGVPVVHRDCYISIPTADMMCEGGIDGIIVDMEIGRLIAKTSKKLPYDVYIVDKGSKHLININHETICEIV